MSKVLLCFLFCCCLVLRSVYGNTSPSIAPTESSIDIPTFAPRLTRRTIPTGQPYALQSLSTPSVPSIASSEPPSCTPSTSFEIPSPTPPFSSTAQPTTDQLIPSAEPGTFKSMSSNLPSSSPDRPTLRPDCFSASVVRASQTLSGVPAEVATNGSFISAIRDSLSDTVSVALDLITEVNVSQTLPDDLKLIYSITVKSCYSAGVVTNNLQTAMDTGTFVEKLLQRTGVSAAVSELEISVDIITLSPSASVVSGIVLSGSPISGNGAIVGGIIGGLLLFTMALAFCWYGIICRRMGNHSHRLGPIESGL